MAGNSSTFYLRQEINESNLKQWQSWSVDINYVVDQFNDVIQNLTDRLDVAEMTIEALSTKMAYAQFPDLYYVKLQSDTISLNTQKNITYAKTCGVYSSNNGLPHMVNIFSTKTIDGLYVNNTKVSTTTSNTNYMPFLQISGSDEGTIINIKSENMTKIGGDIELYFSINSSINSASIGAGFDPKNDDIARLVIKPIYSQAVITPIITVDKSILSKTLVEKTAISTDAIKVSKIGAPIGRYSTTKTVAQIAKNKIMK